MAQFEIREGILDDAPLLVELCEQLGYQVSTTRLRERLPYLLNNPEHVVYVAGLGRADVAGWVHGYLVRLLESEVFVEIGGLVVDRDRRGVGVGRALMAAVEEWARKQRVMTVRLRSNVVRDGAHHFYRRIGYEVVKQQLTFQKSL